ncbi:BNR repeat-containing protein [Fodinibius sp. Rm-B-1B1-1]|uniref:BNR repeat-containing protein n=1 Tax=Fodinibius alkaliphilus TaxID=3140241 RepID=UPI00315AE646
MKYKAFLLFIVLGLFSCNISIGQDRDSTKEYRQYIPIDKGWAKNSINTVIFREKSVFSRNGSQYVAYYDSVGQIIVAKRTLGTENWEIYPTRFHADVKDAHNSISLTVDGRGIIHLAWGMHGDELKYAKSKSTDSLSFSSVTSMTGKHEDAVTYPRFYNLWNGDLLFLYRYGESGSGDIMLNRYDTDSRMWNIVQHPLISGEGERNAYMNSLAIDDKGGWHISWTWRESWDVATNHDIMYAYSPNEGGEWLDSKRNTYELPIDSSNAEVVHNIPQGSELINQTSMTINSDGEPVIATYWKPKDQEVPQFYIVWNDNGEWKMEQVGKRTLDFSLNGGGTKRIPISRPQIIAGSQKDLYLIFRDFERGGGISIAVSKDPEYKQWEIENIYQKSIGLWEPNYDSQVWKTQKELHLFGQFVGQGDAEEVEEVKPQSIFIYKWIPFLYRD